MNNIEIRSTATNAKYLNRYIEKENYTELHITNDEDYDIVIKIDKEDSVKLQNYFWCSSMVGREGYQTPSFYCYKLRRKTHMLACGMKAAFL